MLREVHSSFFRSQPKIVRVLNLWQKNQVFPPDVIQPLLDMASPSAVLAAGGRHIFVYFFIPVCSALPSKGEVSQSRVARVGLDPIDPVLLRKQGDRSRQCLRFDDFCLKCFLIGLYGHAFRTTLVSLKTTIRYVSDKRT